MELTEMLRKWAEIEPDWCQLTGFNIFTIAGKGICADFTYSYTGTYIYERELVYAWVQHAVQGAIQARGFDYRFETNGPLRSAWIYRQGGSVQRGQALGLLNEAEALLSAYLKGLEGQPEAINPATSAGR